MAQVQTVPAAPANLAAMAAPHDGPQAEILRAEFIACMGHAVSGVNLVTTDGPSGRFGVTVSAVSSVSAHPPLLLACLNARSPASQAIEGNGRFCVNVLGADQASVADTFAGRPPRGLAPFDFGCARWKQTTDACWRLDGAIAVFDCALERALAAGSHLIFIGRVLEAERNALAQSIPALAYSRRAYGALHPLT
jgi:flavin reductase (DIM6/NTAB) family NADH-FMN oxidoreductase RutF